MKPGRWLAIIIALYLALGIAYSVVTPLGEAPDEVDHFLYVRYLVEQRAFPVMQAIAAENATMEANQPPLFYLLNAAVTAPFPQTLSPDLPLNACYSFAPGYGRAHFYLHDWSEQHYFAQTFMAFRAARLFSLLMGAATVALAFVLARQMAPARPPVWPLAAGLLAFNPQFLFITASVNNDVLMALLGAAIIATAVAAAAHGGHGRFALLGVLVGLGLLTKFALLALWPPALLAVIGHRYLVIGRPLFTRHSSLFSRLLLVTLLPLLIAGWWYGRAYRLYGDPLAWEVHLQAKGAQVLRTTPFTLADLQDFAVMHFQSYWGWFGWLKLPLPEWVYVLIAVVVALGAVGVVLEMVAARRLVKLSSRQIALFFNLFAVLAIYLSLLRYIQTINWSGYQGRLAFAAAASAAALLALGLSVIGNRLSLTGHRYLGNGRGGMLVTGGFFVLALLALVLILKPAFVRPQLFQPAASLSRNCLEVAGLQIEAVEVEDGRAGDTLALTLHSYAQETAVSQLLRLQIMGREGQMIGQSQQLYNWVAGDLLALPMAVPIAEDAAPVRAVLQIGSPPHLHDLQTVKIAPARPAALPPDLQRIDANFGGQLLLVGYRFGAGDALTLYWQAAANMTADYTTFVHLLDAQSNMVAQADGQPQQGWYPTSIWDVGEMVADEKALPRPSGAGYFQVVAGVYLLQTGQRLPLADGPGDTTELFVLEVTE